MTQYKLLKVKLSYPRLNHLNSAIKKIIGLTQLNKLITFSSNMIGDSNNDTNFLDKLFLTDKLVSKLHKATVNNSSVKIKL